MKSSLRIFLSLMIIMGLLFLILPQADVTAAVMKSYQFNSLELVSVNASGTKVNANVDSLSINENGQYIAFESATGNLVIGDSNSRTDVFVKDMVSGEVERVSIADDGTQGDHESQRPSISSDGRYVAFESRASSFVNGPVFGISDIFVYDRETDTIQWASVTSGGVGADNISTNPKICGTGSKVVFESQAKNLLPQEYQNYLTASSVSAFNTPISLFIHDLTTGQTDLVATAIDENIPTIPPDTYHVTLPDVSADCRYVTFQSKSANFSASNDEDDQIHIYWIDLDADTVIRISETSGGLEGNGDSSQSAISDSGEFVSFLSLSSNLVSGDNNNNTDVFLKNVQTGAIELISAALDGNSNPHPDPSELSYSRYQSMSADARYIAFQSTAPDLVVGDTNGVQDIFVRDLLDDTTVLISRPELGGLSTGVSTASEISADGVAVAFLSKANDLLASDTDTIQDAYVVSFKVTLSPPNLIRPSDDATTHDKTPNFDWEDVDNADGYTLQYSSEDTFAAPTEVAVESSTYTPVAELAAGEWFWRVKSTAIFGYDSDWTETWSFTLADHSTEDFVFTVNTNNEGESTSTQFIIPTTGTGYNYNVDCDNDGSPEATGVNGNYTCDYASEGIYTVRILDNSGNSSGFPRIYFNDTGDKDKLLSVEHWGTGAWSSMEGAFHGCSNLVIDAVDMPDLSYVTTMAHMFHDATSFNQDISSWDVSAVENFSDTFAGTTSFNQNLGSWNVGNSILMSGMFGFASAFNQDISSWDTSNVTAMDYMFDGALSFNQNLNSWDTTNVTTMNGTFQGAAVFNQDLSGWNTSNVTNMSYMFKDAIAFNKDISSWNTSSVINMSGMFDGAIAFNQNIGDWNTANVEYMTTMFNGAASFNQNLSSWNVTSLTDAFNMFKGIILTTQNYDALLMGWDAQALQSGVSFDGGNSYYCLSETARTHMISSDGWSISDGGKDCSAMDGLVLTVQTDHPGSSTDVQFTIPTTGTGYNFNVDCDNDGFDEAESIDGNYTCEYQTAGTYAVRIKDNIGDGTGFPRIYFNNGGDKDKVLTIEQWGTLKWTSMNSAFEGCQNLTAVNGTDIPDLSNVTDMSAMFAGTNTFNGNIGSWNTSRITNMGELFAGAVVFNQNLSNWNTSNVTNMASMFSNALAFNQYIGSWNTGNVTTMESMFAGAIQFDQDITGWNTSSVANMRELFADAANFDQNLEAWNVTALTTAENMFSGVTLSTPNYDALLIGWDAQLLQNDVVFSAGGSHYCQGETARANMVTDHNWTISDAGKLCPLDAPTLTAPTDNSNTMDRTPTFEWQSVSEATGYVLQYSLDDGFPTYTEEALTALSFTPSVDLSFGEWYWRVKATGDKPDSGWSEVWSVIVQDNPADDFVITVGGPTQGLTFTIPTTGVGYDYNVDCDDDGTDEAVGVTGNYVCLYDTAAVHTIRIKDNIGDGSGFPRIYFNDAGDADQLNTVQQWGTGTWASMAYAFSGCDNLKVMATDVPDFSGLTDLNNMFSKTGSAFSVATINSWNTSTVTDMSEMFSNSAQFNDDISGWNTSSVTDMHAMFRNANAFNQNIGGWNTTNVTDMSFMFYNADAFNQDISGWTTSSVTNMSGMFSYTNAFNQDIGGWNTANVTDMSGMFSYTNAFNQDIGEWNTAKVIDMNSMFDSAAVFAQNIGLWNTAAVTDMNHMFASADLFNQNISGWTTSNVTNMDSMFAWNDIFNQDISGWNTAAVTDMGQMFFEANAFNQDIGGWNTANVTDMSNMFAAPVATSNFNQDISNWNTGNVTNMNQMFYNAIYFNQDISGWDTSRVTSMVGMFRNATAFEQNLSTWNVTSLTNATSMFEGAALSTIHYDALLNGWNAQNLQPSVNFNGGNSTYCSADASRTNMINSDGWMITDGGRDCPLSYVDHFVITVQTDNAGSSPSDQFTIPTTGSGYDYTVDCDNDGIDEVEGATGSYTCDYDTAGEYTIRIKDNSGARIGFPRIYFNNSGDKNKLITIEQWGSSMWTSMENAFYGCSNLNGVMADTPDLSNLTSMASMFRDASSFNQDISAWDVSTVTNMSMLFYNADAFDRDLSGWDVSSLTNAAQMFGEMALSVDNYDALLIGWDAQDLQSGVTFGGGNSHFCLGEAARYHILTTDSWSISDGEKQCPPLDTPVLTAPEDTTSISDTTPTFAWEAVDGATSYTIEYTQDFFFTQNVFSETVTESNFTPDNALGEGKWYWRVKAKNTFTESAFSAEWDFTVTVLLSAPSLLTPSDGSLVYDLTPTFDWEDVPDATGYEILYYKNILFEYREYVTESTYTPTEDLTYDTWYWRVKATGSSSNKYSDYSEEWSFTITEIPAPELRTPGNGIVVYDTTPSFDWDDVPDATDYVLQYNMSDDFSSPNEETVTSSAFTMTSLLSSGEWFWRVKASNDTMESVWSDVWSFTIDSIGVPDPRFPKNSYVITTGTSLFKWAKARNADGYEVELYDPNDILFDKFVFDASICGDTLCQFNLPYKLEREYGSWNWRVRGIKSVYGGDWSNPATFDYVQVDPLTITGPMDNAVVATNLPTFTWPDSPQGLYQYVIEVWSLDGTRRVNQSLPVSSVCSSGNCSWTSTTSLPNSTYTWRVMGKKWPNVTDWTASEVFTINGTAWNGLNAGSAFSAPVMKFPKNNFEITAGTTILKWGPVSGATTYVVELYRPNSDWFDVFEVDASICTATDCVFKMPYNLSFEFGSWTWRVRAQDGAALGSWSVGAVFDYVRVDPISSYSPINEATVTTSAPTFTWEESSQDMYQYMIEVWTLDGTRVINKSVNTGAVCSSGTCTWTSTTLLSDGDYKWHVMGKKWPNTTGWTPMEMFTVND